jgi:hypothetical protein
MRISRVVLFTIFASLVVLVPASSASAASTVMFQSPSENIGCGINANGVRCDISKRDWRPPAKPASCPLDWGNAMILERKGRGTFACAGDTVLGQGRHLPYGEAIQRGRFRCVSRSSGVRCTNRRNGHGFALSRQGFRRF